MKGFMTPLRYPGGKQRLWRFVDEVLAVNDLNNTDYVEPFAGGAGIAMALLLRGRVCRVHLNDSCEGVYAFWHSVLNEPERFCRKIHRASLNVDTWKRQREVFRNRNKADPIDLGFATFYLNRCNRSGILNGGIIGGVNQSGEWKMDARFRKKDLIARIEAIADRKGDIQIRNLDAECFIENYVSKLPSNSLVYCDPPYYRKADMLYPSYYKPEDHKRVSEMIQNNITQHWFVSYDYCDEIKKFYQKRESFKYFLQYSAASKRKGSELLIFSDRTKIPSNSSIQSIDSALSDL